jgi:hypothetical protein
MPKNKGHENLKKWKPGESGNPGGRPKLPEDIREARKVNRVEVDRVLNRFMNLSRAEIQTITNDPKAPALEFLLASMIIQGHLEGDYKRISFVFDRLIGSVAQNVTMSDPEGGPVKVRVFTDDQLKKMAKAALGE